MQYTPNTLFLDSSVPNVDLSVGVFIAYEDVAAGKRAKETCDVLAESLGSEWRIETQLASFKALSMTSLRRVAAVEASKADIIVISCNGTQFPPGVKGWIRSWLAHGGRPMAIVALFSCPRPKTGNASGAEVYLEHRAKHGGMQYFWRFASTPAGQWEWNGRRCELGNPL